MKSFLRILFAVSALFATSASAQTAPATRQAATTQTSGCGFQQQAPEGRIRWFLGLYPTHDLLMTWCQLQSLRGDVTFNLWFPYTKASHSWETGFSGQPLPATKIIDLIQSLLPRTTGPATDKDGQPFPKVLLNVAQLKAARANDNFVLDFAPEHPAANELVLWEPLFIQVKPILLAGQEFKLIIRLKPDLGLLSLALQGKATDVTFEGWRGRLTLGSFFSGDCSDLIPTCKDLPETVRFHAPWIVDSVELTAEGESMTASALQIADQLLKTNASVAPAVNPLSGFNVKTGEGRFTLNDPYSTMEFKAKGSPSGTKSISISYRAGTGQYSVAKSLEAEAQKFRGSVEAKQKPQPPVPESLGRL